MGNNWTAGGDKSESLIVFEQMIMNHDDGDDQIMKIVVQIVNGIEEDDAEKEEIQLQLRSRSRSYICLCRLFDKLRDIRGNKKRLL